MGGLPSDQFCHLVISLTTLSGIREMVSRLTLVPQTS